MNRKLVVYMTYGAEAEVFRRCALNWKAYASHFPSIDFLSFKDDIDHSNDNEEVSISQVGVGEYVVRRPFPKKQSSYSENITWSDEEMLFLNEKHKAIWNLMLREYKEESTLFYHINNTSFVCFKTLTNLARFLPVTNVFAGRPILHKSNNFVYLSGSHVLYSHDQLSKIYHAAALERADKMGDYYWGELLKDTPKTLLPAKNIVCEELRSETKGVKELFLMLEDGLAKGHFQFRFKNNFVAGTNREDIDPTLQLYAMSNSLLKSNVALNDSIAFCMNYQNQAVYLQDLIVVDSL